MRPLQIDKIYLVKKLPIKLKMKYRITCLLLLVICSVTITAQVPVREEPRHHPVLQNKYIRLLDVWLPPGDTTLYHIHATPSLFIILSNTVTGSQIKGGQWQQNRSTAGYAWFRSFLNDTLIHRVCNMDTVVYHVNDIEILSSYNTNNAPTKKTLPFTLLFENERSFAYQIKNITSNKQIINKRGPMIAELVSGNAIFFHNTTTNETKEIKAGDYCYIKPGTSFYFSAAGKGEINLVLFEIK